MKTGATNPAGSCLISSASKEGRNLIALIFGDFSDKGVNKWGYSEKLLEYGYESSHNITVKEFLEQYTVTKTVNGAAEGDEILECVPDIGEDEKLTITSSSDVMPEPDIETIFRSDVSAPIEEGEVLGTVTYTVGDSVLYSGDLLAARNVYVPGAGGVEGPISVLEPVQLSEENERENTEDLMLLWLVIPAALISLLILRMAVVRSRVGTRGRKKSGAKKTQYKRMRYRRR